MENFQNQKIKLLNQDAFHFFTSNHITYDLIFLDAVKRDYIQYLPELKKILNPGGIMITDNILFNNKVITNQLAEKYRNGVKLLKEFNEKLANDSDFNTIVLNIGDGLAISILK